MALVALSACAGLRPPEAAPLCEDSGELVTMAQAVPTAEMVPCIEAYPVGWSFSSIDIENGRAEFWLDSDRAGLRAVKVMLVPQCDPSGATPLPPERPGVEAFLRLDEVGEDNVGSWIYRFAGGCVRHEFRFESDDYRLTPFSLDLADTLDLFPRTDLAE